MKHEFNVKRYKNATVYTLESATGGVTSAGSVTSNSMTVGGVRKRGDNLIAQEDNKDKVPTTTPRNFVAKNAKTSGAGAHKDKKKAEKQGDFKHKKSYADALQEKLNNIASEDHTTAADGWGRGAYDTYAGGRHGRGVAEEDDAHQEIGMAGSELYGAAKHAKQLLALIQQHGEHGLEAWQQSKITKAADYLNSVLQSLDYDATAGEQGVAETTGDPKFDKMLKDITGKKVVAKQQKADTKQQSRDAFSSMFGGSSSDLTKNLKIREQGVAETDRGFRGVGGARDREDDEHHHLDNHNSTEKTKFYKLLDDGKLYMKMVSPQNINAAYGDGWLPKKSLALAKGGQQGVAGEFKGELDSKDRFTKDTVQKMFGKLSPDAKGVAEGRFELDRKSGQMRHNKDDADQRHGLYVNSKLVKTCNSRAEAETVKKRDVKFKDATIKKIAEANRNQDTNWRDEADREMAPDRNSPYYVFWTGQSYEWYGDDAPESGEGRYKPKGDSGEIVAINIKDRDAANTIAKKLDDQFNNGSFPNKAVYGRWDKDYNIVNYEGAHVKSMRKMGGYEKEMMQYDLRQGTVKDYANQSSSNTDSYMESLLQKLAEKIPANAPVDVWVKDFQKADPNKYHQFKNKTPEKKSQMAAAASYSAKNPNKK